MVYHQLASYIDHTLLKPEATSAQVRQLCAEALEQGFASVCVNSRFVRLAADALSAAAHERPVAVCSVIGFPLGATSTKAKVAEARLAILDGARELDMVMALGAAKAGEWEAVAADIAAVVEVADAAEAEVIVKVIIECCLLTDEEKRAACKAAACARAAFVKTSTGFASGGATVKDVRLMRKTVGPHIGVKASGGIKTTTDALAMIEAGATRIGTSNGLAIISSPAQALERSMPFRAEP
ncbi:MAG: deoxyribose-phosphate aldolase [Coriobacteriales bacterium]|jgi:deoxyribose-phosphate aldolase|nr:deoxyribose-phosphate aldolase [Coriobacteriales bacterium]